MKKTKGFLMIVALFAVTGLASCQKDVQTCPAGYIYDSYQNACVWTGVTTTTTGGNTTGINPAAQNTTITAMPAFADMNFDFMVDMAGSNTLDGGNSENNIDKANYQALRMTGVNALGWSGGDDYGIISTRNLNVLRANLFCNAASGLLVPRSGQGVVLLQWIAAPAGFLYGSFSYGNTWGTYSTQTPNGPVISTGFPCEGAGIHYYITGYSIDNNQYMFKQ